MKQIDTLSGYEGRELINKIFKELRYEKQVSGLSALITCWKLCTNERELFRYSKEEVTIAHPLGLLSGTAIWLEEIVNRYYYSTMNSFVYFGAAVLLVLIGVRRFSQNVSDDIVIFGIVFEAMMLLMMFSVMLFSPNEAQEETQDEESATQESLNELIIEVGEVSRDFAAITVQFEQITDTMKEVMNQQRELINNVSDLARANALAVAPSPELINTMKQTNETLRQFGDTMDKLNSGIEQIKIEEIDFAVKKELSNMLNSKMKNAD